MAAFQMTCSCGQEIKVDAESRGDAVKKIQSMMDEKAVKSHIEEKHPGEPMPSVAQVHQMIAENTAAA